MAVASARIFAVSAASAFAACRACSAAACAAVVSAFAWLALSSAALASSTFLNASSYVDWAERIWLT